MTRTSLICRSFRQDFPQFVARAEALGVQISLSEHRRNGRERVFWIARYRQLTGYTTHEDGMPFTRQDAEANIDKKLTAIADDRAAMALLSVAQRFARVMAEMRQMTPQSRMIGEARLPGGDRGHCFFMADYEGDARLYGIDPPVARAKATWQRGETAAAQMARFCDAMDVDFAARQGGE